MQKRNYFFKNFSISHLIFKRALEKIKVAPTYIKKVPKANTAFDAGKITINTPTTEAVKSNFNVMAVMKALTNFAGDFATAA
jgi:hypothetical protein